jgi:hypothetical protein
MFKKLSSFHKKKKIPLEKSQFSFLSICFQIDLVKLKKERENKTKMTKDKPYCNFKPVAK